jgi:hypothetical protein
MKRVLTFLVAAVGFFAAPAATASRFDPPSLRVHPTHVRFGRQPFESNTLRSFTITNTSDETLLVTVEQVQVGDDFSPGQTESTCALGDTLLDPGQSCTHVVGFRPSEFFCCHETAIMRVTAFDDRGQVVYDRQVKLSGSGYQP